MTTLALHVDAYHRALVWVTLLMERTHLGLLRRQTPCAEFDVRALMGHLIGTAERGLGTAERRSTRDVPHIVTDVPDTELASRYKALAQQIVTAWSALSDSTEVVAPWGSCTSVEAARGFVIETTVHGWDLAVATDQPSEAPEAAVELVAPHVMATIPARLRGSMYGEAVVPDACAGPTERLANALGHKGFH